MPLTGTGPALGDEIVAAIKATTGNGSFSQDTEVIAIWRAIGTAIVNHITANAVTVNANDSNGDSIPPGTIT